MEPRRTARRRRRWPNDVVRDTVSGVQHRGIYGIWFDADGRVPLIRTSRGPYTGLLDLPGGTPEVGEAPEQTLRRELVEECGVTEAHVLSWHEFDLVVVRDSSGHPIDFRHSGLIAVLEVSQAPSPVRDGYAEGPVVVFASSTPGASAATPRPSACGGRPRPSTLKVLAEAGIVDR